MLAADPGTGSRLCSLIGGAGVQCLSVPYDPSSLDLARVRRSDPALVLVDLDDAIGDAAALLATFRDDLRLRWAQVVPLRFNDVFETPRFATPWVETAFSRDRELLTTLTSNPLDTHVNLAGLGPARLLKIVNSLDGAYTIAFDTPRAACRMTLSSGRIAFVERDGHDVAGAAIGTLVTELLRNTTGGARVRRLGVATDARGPGVAGLLDTHAASGGDASARRNQFALTRPGLVRQRRRLARDYSLSIVAGAVAAVLLSLLLAPLIARLL